MIARSGVPRRAKETSRLAAALPVPGRPRRGSRMSAPRRDQRDRASMFVRESCAPLRPVLRAWVAFALMGAIGGLCARPAIAQQVAAQVTERPCEDAPRPPRRRRSG